MKGISILEGKYAMSMDMYPLQDKSFNRIHPFYDNLKEGRFTTTKCKDCGTRSFPPRVLCPECLSEEMEWVDLPMEGTVLCVSEQLAGVPLGFTPPLIMAHVDLDGELSYLGRVQNCQAGELKAGDRVKVVAIPIESIPAEGKKGAIIEMERVFYVFEKI
ncbi:MAG TPA: hypothetical protein GXZ24_07720 [Firmicutes bacterium]|jgi:uncharacterized OB-fold protein|nr:hypothetical protein [Bacillota bacterium]